MPGTSAPRHPGAHVIATASAARHSWLKGLGADVTIDYTPTGFEDAVADVGVVIDLVGDAHDQTSTRALKVLRPGGLLVAVPAGVCPQLAAAAEAAGVRVTPYLVEPDGAALTTIAGLIDAGGVTVEVAETFRLEHLVGDGMQASCHGEIQQRGPCLRCTRRIPKSVVGVPATTPTTTMRPLGASRSMKNTSTAATAPKTCTEPGPFAVKPVTRPTASSPASAQPRESAQPVPSALAPVRPHRPVVELCITADIRRGHR